MDEGPRFVVLESECADNIIRKRLEPRDYVRENYRNNKRLFTKLQFEELERYLTRGDCTGPFKFLELDGEYLESRESAVTVCQKPQIGFFTYQDHLYEDYGHLRCLTVRSASDYVRMFPPPQIDDDNELRMKFNEQQATWESSTTCKRLRDILSKEKIPAYIDTIACFELGTLEEDLKHTDGRTCRTMTQHAAALTMRDVIQDKTGNKVRILAQDTDYSETTKKVLTAEGIEVVDGFGARGFIEIDKQTVIFTVAPMAPVKQIVADIAHPAMAIWPRVTEAEDENDVWMEFKKTKDGSERISRRPFGANHDSPRTRKLFKSPQYKEVELPDEEIFTADCCLYIKQMKE
ncbi:hypothetical protein HD806DRAFT_522479 [Xylariaceae sp. AK1471]|nr:hypothetical protein HD806DRAFT_522479 [Xylariaceae sp. AK1471]